MKIPAINVGNMAYKEGMLSVKAQINLTEQDLKDFKKLEELGVELTSVLVPDERKTNLMDLINKAEKKKNK